ncbi:MAG: QueT transporter family protein [Oscillospiraceae bacterium]|nr:QueT transporter family protein [Oscillospiraceae bacterium]
MSTYNTKTIAKLAIVAAIYVVLTLSFFVISYSAVQFRISEVLLLLCFFNPKYGISLIIGCFLANVIASPAGPIDWVLGTAHTIIAVLFIIQARKMKLPLWVASLGAIIGTPLIGWALHIGLGFPFIATTLWVALGEFVVVTVVGVPLFGWLRKREKFMEVLG